MLDGQDAVSYFLVISFFSFLVFLFFGSVLLWAILDTMDTTCRVFGIIDVGDMNGRALELPV